MRRLRGARGDGRDARGDWHGAGFRVPAAVLAVAVLAGACTLAPDYRRPAAPVPQAWPSGPAYDGSTDGSTAGVNATLVGWRDFFSDPYLQRLIELALQHNPDARVAALNVAAARAQYRIQRADLFPSISATGTEVVEKFPSAVAGIAGASGGTSGAGGAAAGGAAGGGSGGTATTGSSGSGTVRYFEAGLGFTAYEIDVFGRIRSLSRERLEQYLGYEETRRSTQISLVAEVANAYLTLLADQELLDITRSTLASQQKSYDLTKLSYTGGVVTALDLRQAETSVDTAGANLAQYTRQLAQDQNALAVLLGAALPTDLPPGRGLDEQSLLAELPAGLPSELLTRRPDVLAAEHTLIAANANIGAARAAFFPRITLTGSYGTASTQLSGLFQPGSTAWSFSPQISLPIFAAGANIAALDLAHIEKNVDIAQYEKSIQGAFREVADALAGRGTLDSQIAADRALVDASDESYRLSEMRFRNGVDDYLSVLDSQRAAYSAHQSLVGIKLARLQNLVTLYKALGGGWDERTKGQP